MGAWTWHIGSFMDRNRRTLYRGLTKAGAVFVSQLRKNVGQGQPRKRYVGKRGVTFRGLKPSSPGQFPKKVTGQFQRSITWKADKGRLTLVVGSSLPYAGYLETGTRRMKARPWLMRTLKSMKGQLTRTILGQG